MKEQPSKKKKNRTTSGAERLSLNERLYVYAYRAVIYITFFLCCLLFAAIHAQDNEAINIGTGGVLLICVVPLIPAILIPHFFPPKLTRTNSVISGDYKHQGVMLWRGNVVITLPLFKVLKLTPDTVHSWSTINGDITQISVTFHDGKKSVLKLSPNYYTVLRKVLGVGPSQSTQSTIARQTYIQNMPTREAPYMVPRSAYWATDALPRGDFTVIDVETTGLDASTCDILEIGAIRYRHGKAVAQYRSYIRPLGRLNAAAQAKNRITWADVAEAPYLNDEFPNFLKFIGGDLLLGYNISYDIKFIQTRTECMISNITFDVWEFVRNAINSYNYKLDTLRVHYNLKGKPHTALGDCESTAELYFCCLKDPEARSEVLSRKRKTLMPEQRYAR